jgi:hypothetical protein
MKLRKIMREQRDNGFLETWGWGTYWLRGMGQRGFLGTWRA